MIIVYLVADLVVAWGGQTQEGGGLYGISTFETVWNT